MTFVGKILVIVIMVFALLFLGISTVVFTTRTNWKKATEKQKKKVNELQGQDQRPARPRSTPRRRTWRRPRPTTRRRSTQTRSPDQVARRREQDGPGRDHRRPARSSKSPSRAPRPRWPRPTRDRKETDQLRDQKSAVEKQANEYKLQQTELNDKIRELERQIKTLDDQQQGPPRPRRPATRPCSASTACPTTSRPSRGWRARPPSRARSPGSTPRTRRSRSRSAPTTASSPATSCSSTGPSPRPQYLGKIQIISADPDQAVGQGDRQDRQRQED